MKHYLNKIVGITFILILSITLIGCGSLKAPKEELPTPVEVTQPSIEKVMPLEEEEAAVVVPIIEEPKEVIVEDVEVPEEKIQEKEVIAEVAQTESEELKETEIVEKVEVKEAEKDVKEEVASINLKNITNFPYGVTEINKAEGNDVFNLFIIHTGDINSNMEATGESIGYARLKTMIDEVKSVTNNILLLDAGNVMSPYNQDNAYDGATALKVLDDIGYDAIALSNNEFSFGIDNLLEAKNITKDLDTLKLLSANALDNNDFLYFQPYQVYNYNGFKVAIVALTDFMDVDGVVFDSKVVIDYAQAAVQAARQYVDYVVVLGNFVANEAMAESVIEYLGADLWIDGYAKDVSSMGKMVDDTLYVGSGKNFSQLGVVDLLVKDGDVVSENAFAITAADVDDPKNSALASAYGIVAVPEDSQTKADIEKITISNYKEEMIEEAEQVVTTEEAEPTVVDKVVEIEEVKAEPVVDEEVSVDEKTTEKSLEDVFKKVVIDESKIVVANIPTKLEGSFAAVGVKKTDLTYYLCKAMTRYSEADFTIINAGAINSSIEVGDVTKGDIEKALPYNNVLTVVEMSGQEIYEAIEHGYRLLPEASSQYSQTDLVAIYNRFADPGNRIIRLRTPEGDKIKDTQIYKVATTDYLADGGDGYIGFDNILSSGGLLTDIFEDYLATINPIK